MKHILGNTYQTDFIKISQTDDGIFHANQNGVSDIWTPDDRKVEFIEIGEQVLCNVNLRWVILRSIRCGRRTVIFRQKLF